MKFKFLLLVLWIPFISMGQISIREDVKNLPVIKPTPYDSLSRFYYNGEYYNQKGLTSTQSYVKSDQELLKYIGQKIYFIPFSKQAKDKEIYGISSLKISQAVSLEKDLPEKDIKPFKYILEPLRKSEPKRYEADYQKRKEAYINKLNETIKTDLYRPKYFIRSYDDDNSPIGEFRTPPESFQGKYFKIIDFKFDSTYEYSSKIRMYLTDEQNDTLFMEYTRQNWEWNRVEPFILLSYYEKQKIKYIGNSFIANFEKDQAIPPILDINTGEEIKFGNLSEWKCTGLEFLNTSIRYLQFYLIFQNENMNTIKVRIRKEEKHEKNLEVKSFIEKNEYLTQIELAKLAETERQRLEELEKEKRKKNEEERHKNIRSKYGTFYGNLILENKVQLGMTKEMCELSWGYPVDINRTTVSGLVHEQWVYSYKNYLYFENGKLTAIQN
ncbi:MAG: hypothetical protein K9H64_10335 [Bacteroidales bacterium]|nr:hypothetical protein [Bacteroidales bacterium]MCF8456266.1 hypothetical protein [Bacteroidales bacterium]